MSLSPRVLAAVTALLLAVSGVRLGTHQPDTPLFASDTDAFRVMEAVAEADQEAAEISGPLDAALARQLFGSDLTPPEAFPTALAQARALGQHSENERPDLAKPAWELTGPTNIGGRILDVVVDPELDRTIFAATASGGVWRSDDAGRTFAPAWPTELDQAIGALAISDDGVLYAGTGETGPGGGSMSYGGTGVYRSEDRGETWELVGLEESSRIGRIVVVDGEGDAPDTVFVAASGNLFRDGGQRGVYRSADGGDTWELVLAGDNASTGAADVAVDPSDPDHLLATTWDHRREPDIRRYNGLGSGLYVSNDGGDSWERVRTGHFGPSPDLGRLGVAFAPSDPSVVYLTASGASGAYAGAYKSLDGGTTWVPIAHPVVAANNVVYGWWFGRIFVDPEDADRVYQAGLFLAESTDGGLNWGIVPGVHADQHGMAWDLEGEHRAVYLGNDGGVYTLDEGATEWRFGEYQPFSQLYGLDVGEQNPELLVAGLQDNGVNRSFDDEGTPLGPDEWNSYGGGDGERTLINPEDDSIVYGCSQYGSCFISHDHGDSRSYFDDEVFSTRKNWFTPIEFDPADPSVVYTGGEYLNRSLDDAENWEVISPDLSDGPGRETNPLFINFGTLTTIAPTANSTAEDGVIYAGTDDGNLWYSHDGGTTWSQATRTATGADLPNRWITRVEDDPDDPMTAYVTYSGFRNGDDTPYLFRTTDGGVTWVDITGDLPAAPLNDVNVIDDVLVVAGDVGVFVSQDDGEHWYRLGSELPNAPVHELRWHAPSETLYAATFGRSMWKLELPTSLRSAR
ncbi:MAG: glycosyl hydrolase [Actinobacteria bacterium]|nr:glycosyl hydrolase [Actinomycetota bacterium]